MSDADWTENLYAHLRQCGDQVLRQDAKTKDAEIARLKADGAAIALKLDHALVREESLKAKLDACAAGPWCKDMSRAPKRKTLLGKAAYKRGDYTIWYDHEKSRWWPTFDTSTEGEYEPMVFIAWAEIREVNHDAG